MRRLAIGFILFQALSVLQAQRITPAPASSVRLEVRTRGNQKTFRVGEIVPLELRFSGTVQRELDGRTYDRSGRLDLETYTVEPRSGWIDPLDLYFRTGAFVRGGVGPINKLSNEPILILGQLNEWVRFERAGEYRVTVRSSRVEGTPVTSNEVRLTIVDPTPEWQQETLNKALQVLAVSPPQLPFGSVRTDPGRDAIRVLRFLGTPAAAREMARRLSDVDCILGLAGSPAREAALAEIDKFLKDSAIAEDDRVRHLMRVLTAARDGGAKARTPVP